MSAHQQLSVRQASLLVAEREIVAQVRTKSFVISTAVTLVLIMGGIVLSSLLGGGDESAKVAVVSGVQAGQPAGIEQVAVADRAAGEDLLRADEVDAVLVPDASNPLGYGIVGLESDPSFVEYSYSVRPVIELLEPQDVSNGVRGVVTFAFAIVFLLAAVGSGGMIVQNTIQEKQSRVVEILLAAVPARALLVGKILGNAVIGVGQAVAMAAAAVVGLVITGQTELLSLLSAPMLWFVVFFVFGFTLVAAMFAAAGSMVSRLEDANSVMSPVMMLVMFPYLGVLLFGDNPTVMTVLSYIPFSAPLAMPVRLFFGDAQWWEPLISLVLLVLATLVVAMVASKVYSRSLLRMGARVKLREALKG